jgi:DNA (cytosine-5)-methyltransferase 1
VFRTGNTGLKNQKIGIHKLKCIKNHTLNYLDIKKAFEHNEIMKFQLGELFCGPGGIGYAAITAKIADPEYKILHAWANDYDKDTCETFVENIAKDEKTVICQDVRKLDYNRLQKISNIDALAFGFPCNDFSVVGEQKGMEGVFGPLYSYGIRALEKFKPVWFLAENVGGLRNANDGQAFSKILGDMFAAGYSVYSHLYKFEKYGVPQARHRIIIIGIRKDQDVVYKVPSIEPYQIRTCKDAIENPPIPKNAQNNELTKQSEDVIKRLKYIKPGENAFAAEIPPRLQLNVTGAKISQIYRRLDPKKPAYTITGSGGGGTHVYHWKNLGVPPHFVRGRAFRSNLCFVSLRKNSASIPNALAV